MQSTLSATKALFEIYFNPAQVFAAIRERGMALLPLILVLGGQLAIWTWYYQIVDITWLQERMIESNAELSGPEQRSAAAAILTRSSLLTMSLVGVLVVTPAIFALLSSWFLLAGKLLGVRQPYQRWFAFAVWASAPALLLLPVMALQLLLNNDGQIAPEALNPLSLNQLVFRVDALHPWRSWLEGISLTTVWTILLMAIGFSNWSEQRMPLSLLVAALPFIAVFGVWALRIQLAIAA